MAALRIGLALLAVLGAAGVAGCGSGVEGTAQEPPDVAIFPTAEDGTIDDVLAEAEEAELVVSPVGQVFDKGPNRYGFGVFELDGSPVTDADVAMYFAPDEEGPVTGPLPAEIESMETKPAFESMTTSQDPHAPGVVYAVPEVPFELRGEWLGVAMIRGEDGFEAARVPSPVVGRFGGVPGVGERAPVVHTPTPESVGGDLSAIDTRVPPSDMHADLAKVLGERPVVLLFATPQLCQSRVCGPVVDVMAQVKAETGDAVEFIHMEVYNGNDPAKGLRPQVRRYGLPTEPWLFAIDSGGVIQERIEGAFGLGKLRRTVRRIG